MSFKPEIKVFNDDKFYQNGQNFATYDEAFESARDRYNCWTMADAYRVVEVDSAEFPVNYKREGYRDVMLNMPEPKGELGNIGQFDV